MSARRERFRHIVETLGRHGLGFAAGGLHLERLHLPGRAAGTAGARMPAPERVRLALEELGTVFIKFGQIVSTRTDILPPDYAAELATLQDASPAIPAEQIRAVIAEELGPAAHQLLEGLRDADPHPGNFFVEPDGRLGIIDFGMVGRIDDGARWNLVRVLLAVVDKDPRSLTTAVVRLCGGADGDYGTLQAALGRLLDRYADRPLAEVPLVPVLAELAGLLRTSRLRLPRETALMVKMLVMADGLGKQLDPGFELTEQLGPFTRGVVLSSLSPEAVAERLKKLGWEALRFGIEAPELARRLLEVLERGGVDVHFRAGELQALMDRAEKTGNRIVAGLVVAALIGAVGELVSFQPDRWKRWPKALFTAGLGGVGALGGYLALGSRPHRRRGTG